MLDTSTGRVTPFLNTEFHLNSPEFSPDGRWIAYSSQELQREEIFVQPYPGPGMKQQVSNEGGNYPRWAKNGKQLFYGWQDKMWILDIQTEHGFTTSKPRLLFERPGYFVPGYSMSTYDLSLDGQRFLMVKYEQRKPILVTEMILVQNWFEELKRLVPTGKN